MKKAAVIVLMLLVTCTLQAQECIQVVDEQGFPLSFAAVRSEEGLSLGYTDIDGYQPELGETKTVSIMHVGFEAKKVRLSSVRNHRISLKPSEVYLRQVRVAADKPIIWLRTFYRTYVEETRK